MAETLILDRAEIKALVSPQEALEPMRNAFRLYSTQRAVPALRVPSPLPAPAPSDAGAMILAPGVVPGTPAYTVKVRAKYPARNPAIQGVIILSSLETGATLAIMESGFLTALRTGLAGAPLTYWLALRRGQWPLSVPVRKAFLVRPIVRSTQPQPVDLPATNHPLLAAVPDELLPLPCSSDQSVCRGSGSP